ncbi:hypothetical protein ACT9D3_003898 [Salmonella enterica subsp. diarizonae serovar 50:r:z]
MTLIIQSEAYIIGIEKALDDSERTVGSIIEPQKDGSLRVVATFNEAVASVIEQLDNKVRAAEQRVKEMEAKQQHISLKPQPLTLANETMDVERLREIAEEDNGSDVKFECSVMARMLLSVALNSDPVAYTDAEELESLEGVDGHSYAHLWPNSYGFGKDIALYTVPQMMPLPVNILDDETNRDVFEAWVADYTGHTKGFVRQFRVDDKYRSDSMWNKYWNTWNACRTAMLHGDTFRENSISSTNNFREIAETSTNSPVIPDDWVMVPKEPTQAMIKAWLSEVANFRGHAAGYRAALAASPQREIRNYA